MLFGNIGHPPEHAEILRHFRQQHHPGKEQVHVGPGGDRLPGESQRNQPRCDKQYRAGADPIDLGNAARAQQHQQNAGRDDEDEQKMSRRESDAVYELRIRDPKLTRSRQV